MGKGGGRGRRDDVSRDSEGRISASEYRQEDVRSLPQWNRLRDVSKALMLDERLATQIGKLFYTEQLTASQFEALNRWSAMLNDYDRIQGHRRSPPSPSLEWRSPGEQDATLTEPDASLKARIEQASSALSAGGVLVVAATNCLCRDEGMGAILEPAKRGANLLAEHFQLTGTKKRAR